MARPYKHIEPFSQRIFNYCDQRIYELKQEIEAAQEELAFFTQLRFEQNKCEACGGVGSVRDRLTENDYGPPYTCEACNGRGERQDRTV